MRSQLYLMLFLTTFTFSGCTSPDPDAGKKTYTVNFDAMMGDKTFDCKGNYEGVGKTGASISLLAFRLYVHDVQLVRKDGTKFALELKGDNKWQREGVALLDFVDDQGNCKTGSPAVNKSIIGLAPEHDDYTGIAFKVGMPSSKNNSMNAAVAPPPFNESGMWWTWKAGYKYIRLDVKTDKHKSWFFHLGSSQCSGTIGKDYKCTKGNLTEVNLSNFQPGKSKVIFDVAALYKDADLNAPIDFTKDENKDGKPDDTLPGCMFEQDPECSSLFQSLGLSWGTLKSKEQTVFKVQ